MTRLQGYIVLWSDEADVDGTLETFGPIPSQEPLVAHLTAAHLPGHRYAYTTSGQLRLEQDDVGLRLEVDAGEDREWAGSAVRSRPA